MSFETQNLENKMENSIMLLQKHLEKIGGKIEFDVAVPKEAREIAEMHNYANKLPNEDDKSIKITSAKAFGFVTQHEDGSFKGLFFRGMRHDGGGNLSPDNIVSILSSLNDLPITEDTQITKD